MTDTLPGRQKPDATWGGMWTTIERSEYHGIIASAGGLEALTVAAAATHPNGDDYVYTAWARRDQDYPLVAAELEGCAGKRPEDCGGTHTFWKFIPWPRYRCTGCGESERRQQPTCGASAVLCEDCGQVMRETEPRKLLTGNPAMARKPGRDVVDLALYEDDPEYRAMIDAKYPPEPAPRKDERDGRHFRSGQRCVHHGRGAPGDSVAGTAREALAADPDPAQL